MITGAVALDPHQKMLQVVGVPNAKINPEARYPNLELHRISFRAQAICDLDLKITVWFDADIRDRGATAILRIFKVFPQNMNALLACLGRFDVGRSQRTK